MVFSTAILLCVAGMICFVAFAYAIHYVYRALEIALQEDEVEEEHDLTDTISYYHPAIQDEIHQDDVIPDHVKKFLDEKHNKK